MFKLGLSSCALPAGTAYRQCLQEVKRPRGHGRCNDIMIEAHSCIRRNWPAVRNAPQFIARDIMDISPIVSAILKRSRMLLIQRLVPFCSE